MRCSPIQFLLARRQPVGDGRIRSSPRPWCVAVFVQDSVHSSKLLCRRSGQVATMGRRPWTPERTTNATRRTLGCLGAIKMVKDRHPPVAELIVSALEGGLDVWWSIQAVTQGTQVLERFRLPSLGTSGRGANPMCGRRRRRGSVSATHGLATAGRFVN